MKQIPADFSVHLQKPFGQFKVHLRPISDGFSSIVYIKLSFELIVKIVMIPLISGFVYFWTTVHFKFRRSTKWSRINLWWFCPRNTNKRDGGIPNISCSGNVLKKIWDGPRKLPKNRARNCCDTSSKSLGCVFALLSSLWDDDIRGHTSWPLWKASSSLPFSLTWQNVVDQIN